MLVFFLRFVSIPLSYLKKGITKTIGLGFFKVCKYTSLIFEKADKQKNCAVFLFLTFASTLFLIFEKGGKEKNSARFFQDL